jgi:hypothetical protein
MWLSWGGPPCRSAVKHVWSTGSAEGTNLCRGTGHTLWRQLKKIVVLATWHIRSKIRPFKRENSPTPPCKQRRVGVQSDLVNSIPLARMTLFSCDGEVFVMAGILTHLWRLKDGCLEALSSRFARWTKPPASSLPLQTLADLGRSKSELLAENGIHPLLWRPEIVGQTHHLCRSSRAEGAKPQREMETEDGSVRH